MTVEKLPHRCCEVDVLRRGETHVDQGQKGKTDRASIENGTEWAANYEKASIDELCKVFSIINGLDCRFLTLLIDYLGCAILLFHVSEILNPSTRSCSNTGFNREKLRNSTELERLQ